jgi:hypothetical protein
MKKVTVFLVIICSLIIGLTSCKKDDLKCANESEFCAFVSSKQYNQTGSFINQYLSKLNNELTETEKLERLKDWLKCKSCVANVEILCNSCIYTYPAQSELKIWFTVDGQQSEKCLDIIMDNPLRFRTYHE